MPRKRSRDGSRTTRPPPLIPGPGAAAGASAQVTGGRGTGDPRPRPRLIRSPSRPRSAGRSPPRTGAPTLRRLTSRRLTPPAPDVPAPDVPASAATEGSRPARHVARLSRRWPAPVRLMGPDPEPAADARRSDPRRSDAIDARGRAREPEPEADGRVRAARARTQTVARPRPRPTDRPSPGSSRRRTSVPGLEAGSETAPARADPRSALAGVVVGLVGRRPQLHRPGLWSSRTRRSRSSTTSSPACSSWRPRSSPSSWPGPPPGPRPALFLSGGGGRRRRALDGRHPCPTAAAGGPG